MLLTRRISARTVWLWGLQVGGLGAAWAAAVFSVHYLLEVDVIRIPFLPIATIGTAVAFYVGFKNNAAYERFWEGRKIWGGVVNESRSWAAHVLAHVHSGEVSAAAHAVHRELIYRHLAWVNALRLQLRRTTRFSDNPAPATRRRLERHAEAMRNDWDKEMAPFLSPEELVEHTAKPNSATSILITQAQRLEALRREQRLELFHQRSLMEIHRALYALQGKCERIKNTPFPRLYAEYSRVFVQVFVFLLPFGMLDVFSDLPLSVWGALSATPAIVASALITWVFFTMEGIGDASEDPFEQSMNDVPMNALARTIEIDLRAALGESDLPPKEPAHDGILY